MKISISRFPWREVAVLELIEELPGHAVERIKRRFEDVSDHRNVSLSHEGFAVYECVAEVHMASNEHEDHSTCSWRPLLGTDGFPWVFDSVGLVNTCLRELKNRALGKAHSQPQD